MPSRVVGPVTKRSPNGTPIIELAEIGSTNAEAIRLGLGGMPAPFWVRADRQTAGRGRSGRPWTSDPGNHYGSLLLRLDCSPTVLHHLSFVAAVGTVAALKQVAGPSRSYAATDLSPARRHSSPPPERLEPQSPEVLPTLLGETVVEDRMRGCCLPLQLKWPNDILVDGAKLVGILAESSLLGDGAALAALGIGINLAHAPAVACRATTCLLAHGIAIDPAAMLDALAVEMADALALWNAGAGFTEIRRRWLADATPPGTPMSVHTGRDKIDGTFAGVDDDGALILRDHSGYDRRMTFGDVTLQGLTGAG